MNKIIKLLKTYKFHLLSSDYNLNKMRYKFPKVYIANNVLVDIKKWSHVIIGEGTVIHDYNVLCCADDKSNPMCSSSALEIGKNVYIGEFNNIRAGGGYY